MNRANPLWDAPRIHGERLTLGIELSQATVGRHLARRKSRATILIGDPDMGAALRDEWKGTDLAAATARSHGPVSRGDLSGLRT
jgi:hypothetical protein